MFKCVRLAFQSRPWQNSARKASMSKTTSRKLQNFIKEVLSFSRGNGLTFKVTKGCVSFEGREYQKTRNLDGR